MVRMIAICNAPCHMFSGRMHDLAKRRGPSQPYCPSHAISWSPYPLQKSSPQKPALMLTSHLNQIQAYFMKPMDVRQE